MSPLEVVNPEALGAPRGYSNGMLAPVGSRLLMIAGQIAWDGEQKIVSDDFTAQFAQAMKNVIAVVEEAGGGPEHLGSLTIFVTDKREYLEATKGIGAAYTELMGRHFPAMALIEISSLLDPRAKIEIQGLAAVPAPSAPPSRERF